MVVAGLRPSILPLRRRACERPVAQLHQVGEPDQSGISNMRLRHCFLCMSVVVGCEGSVLSTEQTVTFVARPDLTIGVVEGQGPDVFGAVSGLAVDTAGRIYVADAQAHEVRVFDANGSFQFRFARKGGGPGELDGPCCLALDRNGRLWVRDGNNARYNRYRIDSAAASYEGMIRMSHGARGFWSPTTFDSDGNLIDVGMAPTGLPPPVARYRVDMDGVVLGSVQIAQPPRDSVGEVLIPFETSNGLRGVRYYQQPFGPQHRIAHSPTGDWAKVITSRYSIEWFDEDNELLRVVTRDVPAIPVSPAEHDSAEAVLLERVREGGARMSDLPWGIPSDKTPVLALYFDELGRLWVERSVAAGQPRLVDVFATDGSLRYSVQMPNDVRLFPAAIMDGTIVAVRIDELGVHRVVRLVYGETPTSS